MTPTKLKYLSPVITIILFFATIGWTDETSVIDAIGRRTRIPASVDRIGALYAFAAHAVAMLGKADRIVAVSNGPKRDILLNRMYPGIKNALVPKYQGAINIEELARAKPDLVLVAAETGLNEAEKDKLDTFGIPWLAIDFRSMEQQRATIAMIGAAIGAREEALKYNRYYLKCLARVQKIVSDIADAQRVTVFLATNEPTRTALPVSLPSDWLRAAGAVNVATQAAPRRLEGKNQLNIEQILLWNPQVILANEPGAVSLIQSSPKWSAVEAVRTGKVFQMPIGISRWGHPGSLETPLAVLWTAKTLYPELFKEIDMRKELRYFYRTFFSHDLSEKMVQQVLAGRGMRLTKNRKKVQ